METSESVHCLPSSLSAVFDSSDDDDLLNSEASQETDNQAGLPQDPAQDDSSALMHAQLLKLSEEYREAGLTQCYDNTATEVAPLQAANACSWLR